MGGMASPFAAALPLLQSAVADSDWANHMIVLSFLVVLAALVVVVVRRFYRRHYGPDAPSALRGGGVRSITDEALPGVVLEIGDQWPGRTRIRVAAPAMLPLQGPARLAPRALRRGKQLSPSFGDLVWTGRGADDLEQWAEVLHAPLRALYGFRDRYTLQATLTPFGLMVHMPLVAARPNEEAFLLTQARALHAALGVMADAAGPEGLDFQSPMAEPQGECSTCWEPVPTRASVQCAACGGRQHHDCREYMGGCGRFACDGVDPLAASLQAARRDG